MAMRTIILKLHKPSGTKIRIIEEAMDSYTSAYRYLLCKAYGQLDYIRENYRDRTGKFRALNIAKWIDKDISKELNRFGIEPFKDSLKLDFGMTLAGYLNLEGTGHRASYPLLAELQCGDIHGNMSGSLPAIHEPDDNIEKENSETKEKYPAVRPLLFCRYSINRDFCLLYDSKNKKYYAKLYLMNRKNENKRQLQPSRERPLVYIHETGKQLETSDRKVRFLLLPLSFGKWQEEYLKKGIENPQIFKTARLRKRGDDYYLSINLEFEEPQKTETSTFLGVSRGLKSVLKLTIVDQAGRILDSIALGEPETKKNTGRSFPLAFLHKLTNDIVEIALKNKSQVIVHPFVNKGDQLQWVNKDGRKYIPVLRCRDYNLIVKMLEYKLTGKGLPEPVRVSPSGIFYTCPQCGLNAKCNRFSHDMFICTACGKIMDIDSLGSFNLAGRLLHYKNKALKVKLERIPGGAKFTNIDLDLECCIYNPQDTMKVLSSEIYGIIESFYTNIGNESKHIKFKKKYSLIKKLQQGKDFEKLIEIIYK